MARANREGGEAEAPKPKGPTAGQAPTKYKRDKKGRVVGGEDSPQADTAASHVTTYERDKSGRIGKGSGARKR